MTTVLDDARFADLLRLRLAGGAAVEAAAERRPRPVLDGRRLMIVAMDHPARRILGVSSNPRAMVDRRDVLDRTIRALRRPGVDGLLATPDVVEDLLLLGELDHKVVFGSMNRGGLTGSAWELDDRFTAYDAATIERLGLDGGKMLLRFDFTDPGTLLTMEGCAGAIADLASRRLIAMLEPLSVDRTVDGKVVVSSDLDRVTEVVAIANGLGPTTAYTWLKLPAVADPEAMMAATSLPSLLLGGDPGGDTTALYDLWERAMSIPHVRGLVAGRSLLHPPMGDVETATDEAVALVRGAGR